jgi:hypothetical protein
MQPTDDYQQRLSFLLTRTPEELLRELLATLHGDGGHYTDAHGLAKSVLDAEYLWLSKGFHL